MLGMTESATAFAALLRAIRSLPRGATLALAGCMLMAASALLVALAIAPAPLSAQA